MDVYRAACQVAARLQDGGHLAYFAGGCVRDRLLGRDPNDYDIATSAPPEVVQRLYRKSKLVGAHFGVVIVREGPHQIEVATFREDGDYGDGRRPDSVRFAGPEEDAGRRDFTINGLFEIPGSGEIIDHVGGRADLETGVLRAIGDPAQRFGEDHLRLLRAVRFAAQIGFEIEGQTWKSLCDRADDIAKVSVERVREEFSKTMRAAGRVRGFDLLVESGLMRHIIPEIYDLQGCEQPPEFHPEGDVFVHTRLMLTHLEDDASLHLVLSVLLHDIGKPATKTFDEEVGRIRFNGHDRVGAEMAREILERLRYPKVTIEAVSTYVGRHMQFLGVQNMRTATLKKFMGGEHFGEELALHRADCLGSNGNLGNHEFLLAKIDEFANEPVLPPPHLKGEDLLDRGWEKGPGIGRTLSEAYDLQLEGVLADREAALLWLGQREAPPN